MQIKENIVIDNSVVIKILRKEDGYKRACEIIDSAKDLTVSLMAPEIFIFEFYNVASRLVGSDEAYNVMDYLKETQFSVIPLDEYGTLKASQIMDDCKNKVSFYDASYHALAFQMDATFVTADERYYNLAKSFGKIEVL